MNILEYYEIDKKIIELAIHLGFNVKKAIRSILEQSFYTIH